MPSACGSGPIRSDSNPPTQKPPAAYPAAPSMNVRSPLSANLLAAQITPKPRTTSHSDWYKKAGWKVA